jgi:hypothetical protein
MTAMHEAERERLEHNIEYQKSELRRALRDLGISVLFGMNLPRRIRRRPVPWTLAAVGVAAFFVIRSRRRAQAPKRLRSGARR